jgi:hypothetical protein
MTEREDREVDHVEYVVDFEDDDGETVRVQCADEDEAKMTAEAVGGRVVPLQIFKKSWTGSVIRSINESERSQFN